MRSLIDGGAAPQEYGKKDLSAISDVQHKPVIALTTLKFSASKFNTFLTKKCVPVRALYEKCLEWL